MTQPALLPPEPEYIPPADFDPETGKVKPPEPPAPPEPSTETEMEYQGDPLNLIGKVGMSYSVESPIQIHFVLKKGPAWISCNVRGFAPAEVDENLDTLLRMMGVRGFEF